MLERKLSPAGRIVFFVSFGILFGVFVILEFMGKGPISWVDEFQSNNVFNGSYYPKISFLVVGLIVMFPCFGAAYGFDYIFKKGMFEPRENQAPPFN